MGLNDRKERLANICRGHELDKDLPLLKSFPIESYPFDRLKKAVTFFLFDSIVANNPNFKGKMSNDFFETHINEIEALSTITPSGMVLAKRQNYVSYNLIHMALASIVQGLKIDEFVDKIHMPINIRFVRGTTDADLENRPRYTGKIHSDIWAGEPTHAIMVFLPIFGDFSQTGVEFFEPLEFPTEYKRPLDDFNEGAHLVDDAVKYPSVFTAGSICIADTFLLHKTMQKGGNPRLSIDFRFLARDIIASDEYIDTPRLSNYISYEDWAKVGIDRVFVSRDNLEQFQGDRDVTNYYPTSFELLKI